MPLDIRIRFGRAIRRIREEQKINQEEAAERCGLHRTYYSGIQRGVRNVSLVNIEKIGTGLRTSLLKMSGKVGKSVSVAAEEPSTSRLQDVMRKKEHAHKWVRGIEKIWDFYFELFGQRQTRYAKWLLSCDRIGLDCYRAYYLGIGVARPIPSPPPFSYMATGFAPATFRYFLNYRRV